MSVWYELFGVVNVRACNEAKAIAEKFAKSCGELTADYTDNLDGTATVEFSGGVFTSHGSIEVIDEQAQALAPYVVEPAFLHFNYDHTESGKLYVGLAEKEAEAKSRDALNEIKNLLDHLTASDKEQLRILLNH
jgi:hypothetical protein